MTSNSSGKQRAGNANLRALQFEVRKPHSTVQVSLREGLDSLEVGNESSFFSTEQQGQPDA